MRIILCRMTYKLWGCKRRDGLKTEAWGGRRTIYGGLVGENGDVDVGLLGIFEGAFGAVEDLFGDQGQFESANGS